MAEVLLFHHAQGLTEGCLASLPDYDEDAAALLRQCVLAFFAGIR